MVIDFLFHRGKHGLRMLWFISQSVLLKKPECDTVFLVNVVLKLLNVSAKAGEVISAVIELEPFTLKSYVLLLSRCLPARLSVGAKGFLRRHGLRNVV